MINICILGTGKVGTHLINACSKNKNINITQIYSKSNSSLLPFQDNFNTTKNINNLKHADIYIIALPDDVLPTINLQHLTNLVVHTSGTVSFKALHAVNRGVLYPLQSFSKEKEINMLKVPFCLETEFEKDYKKLEYFTQQISETYQEIDEIKRQKIHLAAVFANNFSNRVIGIAHDICKEENIDFNLLKPLIQETFFKIQTLEPNIAQTGPALREDNDTITKHLSQLKGTNKNIYQILTKSIQERKYEKL